MPHSEIMTNTVTGVVATTTIASGIATWFDVLEHGVGLLASLAGLILASLLIWKAWVSIQTKRLELKTLEDEERRKNDRPD
jgi:hypothetical protein